MAHYIDLTGQQFGRLTVLSIVRRVGRRPSWQCACQCGRGTIVEGSDLRRGGTQSCGCLRSPHGETSNYSKSREYIAWENMVARCHRPSHPSFHHYGGRGIIVCERWRRGDGTLGGFQCFLADMGRRPSSKHSLERTNNNEGYKPGNCEWATSEKQNWNKRRVVLVEYCGRKMAIISALKEANRSIVSYYRSIGLGIDPQTAFDQSPPTRPYVRR